MQRVTLILACAVIFLFALSNQTNAAAPQLINYQGVLADSTGAGLNTTVNITFTIYDDPSAGSVLWTEVQNITVVEGLFSALLGEDAFNPLLSSIFSDPLRYLGIKVGADPEISPRTQIVSVAYALRSDQADFAANALHADTADIAANALHADTADFADTSALAVFSLVTEIAIFADSSRVADSLDSFSSEDFSLTGHSHGGGWTPFPYDAGFNNYETAHPGQGYQLVQYRKIGDIVYLRGWAHKDNHAILSGTIGLLPVGFRPPARLLFHAYGVTTANVQIIANGQVLVSSASDWQSLDGVFFSVSP